MMTTSALCYESRACFSLWSRGDLATAIRENHQTYLSQFWEEDHFYVFREDGTRELSFYRALWSLAVYPVGMIGYLLSTLLKIILLIGNLTLFIVAVVTCQREWQRERGLFLLDNMAAVGIGLIGIVTPPLAYKLEKIAENYFLQFVSPKKTARHAPPCKIYPIYETPMREPDPKNPRGRATIPRKLF